MSVFRIYPTKSNTIASGLYKNYNSGQNSVCDLWYGGGGTDTAPEKRNSYSRFIAKFDITDLQNKISNKEILTGNTVSYRLKMKNSIPKDKLLDPEYEYDILNKAVAASFDLICFPINKDWDQGRGYDLSKEYYLVRSRGDNPLTTGYSNWQYAKLGDAWDAPGVYVDPSGSTYVTYTGATTQSGMTISALQNLTSFDTPTYFNFNTSPNQFMQNGAISATTIGNNISVNFANFYSGETTQTGMTLSVSNQAVSTGWTFTTSADTLMGVSISAITFANNTYVSFNPFSGQISTLDWYNSINLTSFSGFGISVTGYSSTTYINSAGTSIFTLSANTISNPVSTQSWVNSINNTSFSGFGITITGNSLTNYIGSGSFVLSADTITFNPIYYAQQHFDLGNEDIDMDITPIVNDWLSGGSQNNGLGIAYSRYFELLSTDTRYIASFFTENTNTAYKPYIEVTYNQAFIDDRLNVNNNRFCKLFLYTFSGNDAANYYSAGTVTIRNSSNAIVYSGLTPIQIDKGVYYVDVWMSGASKGQQYKDVWEGVTFNPGIDKQDYTQFFVVQDNYYFRNAPQVNAYSLVTYGIDNDSIISSDENIRIYCDLRVNFSTNAPKTNYDLQYRMIMNLQDEVVPWTSINQAIIDKCPSNYFDLQTNWLLSNQTYEIQFRVKELGTARIQNEKIKFKVINKF